MSLHPEITYVKLIGNFPIYPLSKIQEACLIKGKEFLIKFCNSYSFRSLDRYVCVCGKEAFNFQKISYLSSVTQKRHKIWGLN